MVFFQEHALCVAPKAPAYCFFIHALRMESDSLFLVRPLLAGNISIHALRMEGDSAWLNGFNCEP